MTQEYQMNWPEPTHKLVDENTNQSGLTNSQCVSVAFGFMDELEKLLNKYSIENESNTPDFILAAYVRKCLLAFAEASRSREKWYGRELRIGDTNRASAIQDFNDRISDA